MPENNLSMGFVVDTKGGRYELELLNAKMAETQKQIKATREEAAKGNPQAIANLKTLTNAMDTMAKSHTYLQREVSRTTRTVQESSEGFRLHERNLKSLHGALTGLGDAIAGVRGGMVGFIAAFTFDKVLEQVKEADQRLRDIRDLSANIGAKPLFVQSVQELVKETGASAEQANKFLTGIGATLQKIATSKTTIDEAQAKIQAAQSFGDQGVRVMRGGQQPVRDFSDPLAILGVNEALLRTQPVEKQLKTLGDAFARVQKNARALGLTEIQLNEIAKEKFGVPAADVAEYLGALSKIQQKTKELENADRSATEKHLENVKKLDQANQSLAETWEEAWGKMADATTKFWVDLDKFFEKNIKQLMAPKQFLSDWTKDIGQNFQEIGNFLSKFLNTISPISGAIAAEMPKAGAGTTPATTLPDVNVSAARADMPVVYRGPSSLGDTSGHGPESIGGAETGHGPGSRPTQSLTPGTSDYQAPEFRMVQPMLEAAGQAADASKTAAERSADAAESAKSAAEASQSAVNAWVQSSAPPGGALGGLIRGPGSGTSDSIMARLSNGEFVMRAAAVSHWGPSAMAALNGLRNPFGGGSLPRFAEGGLVGATAGGTPVHVHLDGQAFAMHATEGVASALVVAARRQQMRSAGVKPSWYGGRPGS